MAREQQQPMSDAWLAFVLEQIATIPPERDHTSVPVSDLQLLLAEVERLRAREAALMAFAREIASGKMHGIIVPCPCDGDVHEPECWVTQARALLASAAEAEAAQGEA